MPRSSAPRSRQTASERSGSGSVALSSTLRRGADTAASLRSVRAAMASSRGRHGRRPRLLARGWSRSCATATRRTACSAQTLDDAAMILAYEAMRGLRHRRRTRSRRRSRPADGVRLADQVVIVAILRAGLGLVDGFLRLVPDARVGHLGMYRDEEALRPVGYYENIPPGVEDAEVFVVDPMLATGGSATQAIARLKRAGARRLRSRAWSPRPRACKALRAAHPEVPIITAALDRELDEQRLHPPRAGRRGRPHLRHRPLSGRSTLRRHAHARPRPLLGRSRRGRLRLGFGAPASSTPEPAVDPRGHQARRSPSRRARRRRSSSMKDLKVGSGPVAKAGEDGPVQYVGISFANGSQFDASWDRGEPFELPARRRPGHPRLGPGRRGHEGRRPPAARDPARPRLRQAGLAAGDRAERDAGVRDRPARRREAQAGKPSPPTPGGRVPPAAVTAPSSVPSSSPFSCVAREVARARSSRGSRRP